MIGSNEDYWKEYQKIRYQPKYQSVQAKKARLVQSGIDPEESFNTVRGGLIAVAIVLACVAIVWLVT